MQLTSGLWEKGYYAMIRKRSSSILAHLDSCLGQALRVTHNARPERDESTAIFVLAVHLQWPMTTEQSVFSSACAFAT